MSRTKFFAAILSLVIVLLAFPFSAGANSFLCAGIVQKFYNPWASEAREKYLKHLDEYRNTPTVLDAIRKDPQAFFIELMRKYQTNGADRMVVEGLWKTVDDMRIIAEQNLVKTRVFGYKETQFFEAFLSVLYGVMERGLVFNEVKILSRIFTAFVFPAGPFQRRQIFLSRFLEKITNDSYDLALEALRKQDFKSLAGLEIADRPFKSSIDETGIFFELPITSAIAEEDFILIAGLPIVYRATLGKRAHADGSFYLDPRSFARHDDFHNEPAMTYLHSNFSSGDGSWDISKMFSVNSLIRKLGLNGLPKDLKDYTLFDHAKVIIVFHACHETGVFADRAKLEAFLASGQIDQNDQSFPRPFLVQTDSSQPGLVDGLAPEILDPAGPSILKLFMLTVTNVSLRAKYLRIPPKFGLWDSFIHARRSLLNALRDSP